MTATLNCMRATSEMQRSASSDEPKQSTAVGGIGQTLTSVQCTWMWLMMVMGAAVFIAEMTSAESPARADFRLAANMLACN